MGTRHPLLAQLDSCTYYQHAVGSPLVVCIVDSADNLIAADRRRGCGAVVIREDYAQAVRICCGSG